MHWELLLIVVSEALKLSWQRCIKKLVPEEKNLWSILMDLTRQWRWLEVQTLAGAQTQQFACLQYFKINHILFSWSQMVDKLKLCVFVFVFEKWEASENADHVCVPVFVKFIFGNWAFFPPYLLGEKPRKSTGHIWLSSVLIFLPPLPASGFPPTLISDLHYFKAPSIFWFF